MSDIPSERLDDFEARVTGLVIRIMLLGLFAYLSLALIRPFLPVLVWAVVLAVTMVLIWAWFAMTTGHALLLTVLLVPLTLMDNALMPMLMGRGLSTPTLVIFLGVISGTLTFGLIGLFLGPVVLAVFYDRVVSWALYGTVATGVSVEGVAKPEVRNE